VPPHRELGQFVSQLLQESGIEKQASVRADAFGVAVVFESAVFFDTLSADIRPQGRFVLERLIEGLGRKQLERRERFRIVVEGHTDQRPIVGGDYPSNWELSGARASRVVRLFLDQGFEPAQLVSIGYADTRPERTARRPSGEWDEQALNQNRRVVVRILEQEAKLVPITTGDPGARQPAAVPNEAEPAVAANPPNPRPGRANASSR
jgi:chemotaxis protein MotB